MTKELLWDLGKHSTTYEFQLDDPVGTGFKWVLLLGRVFGISPISVRINWNGGNLRFRWLSLSVLHSLSMITLILTTYIPGIPRALGEFGDRQTILGDMAVLAGNLYNWLLILVCLYWLRSAPQVILLFQKWSETMKTLSLKTKDNTFPRFCSIITVVVMGGCVIETILFTLWDIQKNGGWDWGSPILRLGIFSWTFADIFVILWCRAISHKFEEVNQEIALTLEEFQEQTNNQLIVSTLEKHASQHFFVKRSEAKNMGTFWQGMREKILALCGLSHEMGKLVAPVILISYTHIILLLITHVLRFVYESKLFCTEYVYVSVIQYGMRLILVTYYASQVHHSSIEILKSMDHSPDSIFSPEAYRLERMLARRPAGVKLFGTVIMTRQMFISILSFMFTAEIVLLQAMGAVNAKNKDYKN